MDADVVLSLLLQRCSCLLRRLKCHGRQILAGAALACIPLAGLADEEAATVPMALTPVAPQVWAVLGESALGSSANQNFISNAGFVVTGDGVAVIDALGSPPLAKRFLQLIRTVTDQPVRWVIVTHYHADHIYGLQVFRDAGAQVIAQAKGADYLASDTARQRLIASREQLFPWVDEDTRLVPADRWLPGTGIQGGVTLTLGGVEFLLRPAGPAHTPEDLVVFLPRQRVLFAGDLVFRGRIPYVGQADSRGWISALEGLVDLKPALMVPGHGPVSHDPLTDLVGTRDYLRFLRQAMGEAARQMEPFEDAYAHTDWERFRGMPLFDAANRMNAYNTYLLLEKESE